MIVMEIIVQEHKLHVFRNLVYSFSATQMLFCVLVEKLIKYTYILTLQILSLNTYLPEIKLSHTKG
jgi:hypothetical protein